MKPTQLSKIALLAMIMYAGSVMAQRSKIYPISKNQNGNLSQIEPLQLDTASPPVIFSITSNVVSRACGSGTSITFSVENVNNYPGVTDYIYHPSSGDWLYNGSPAPATITRSENFITLTAVDCGGAGSVYAVAYMASTGHFYQSDTKEIPVRVPNYVISAPVFSNSNYSNYELNVFPNLPVTFLCPTTINWALSDYTLASLSHVDDVTVKVSKGGGHGGGTGEGTIILSATVQLCEQTVTATRSVTISSSGVFSGKLPVGTGELKINRIYPNPSKGIFTFDLNRNVDKANVTIQSIDGRTIISRKVSGYNFDLDISGNQSGIYFVKVVDGSNTTTEKIVKQ